MKSAQVISRVSPRVRLGADLVAIRHGISMGVVVERALELMLEKEGLTVIPPDGICSLLDELAPLGPGERLALLRRKAPRYLSEQDRYWLASIEGHETEMGRPMTPAELNAEYRATWGSW